MSQWAREHPEEMAEIAALPLRDQGAALRAAQVDPLEAADRLRDEDDGVGFYSSFHVEPAGEMWSWSASCGANSRHGTAPSPEDAEFAALTAEAELIKEYLGLRRAERPPE